MNIRWQSVEAVTFGVMKPDSNKAGNQLFWIATGLALLLFAFLAAVLSREWWTIAIAGNTGSYPWGRVNNNPWFYASPDLYAAVQLASAVVLAVPVGRSIWCMYRKDKPGTMMGLLGCLVVVVLIIVSGSIH